MSSIRNSVRLIGNLGQDPEIKNLEGDKKLAKFSIATKEIYKNDAGEKVTETQWHNLSAWGNTATIAEKYLKKGKEVAIEGKLVTRSYTDKEGIKKYATEILFKNLIVI
jgi:single-strand DNA-binding protein